MSNFDSRVDAYIDKSADFAKPILEHIRELVHKACPEVEETMKWSFPHFDYKGPICHMASFKQHCTFGFWKGELMRDDLGLLKQHGESAMGHFGRITSIKDLPSNKIMIAYIKEAMRLNQEGIKKPARSASKTAVAIEVPDYFMKALKKNKSALSTFEKFSNSNKKEYVQWVTEAKTETTRDSRLATAVEWMSEGKIKNWKYVK